MSTNPILGRDLGRSLPTEKGRWASKVFRKNPGLRDFLAYPESPEIFDAERKPQIPLHGTLRHRDMGTLARPHCSSARAPMLRFCKERFWTLRVSNLALVKGVKKPVGSRGAFFESEPMMSSPMELGQFMMSFPCILILVGYDPSTSLHLLT